MRFEITNSESVLHEPLWLIPRSWSPTNRPATPDPDTSNQILDLLKRLNQQLNVTLLMVTHDADAAPIADKQFRLDHGKLRQETTDNRHALSTAE